MIYIDPPYNTGKDFIYKDNFAGNDLKGRLIVDLIKTNVFLGKKPEYWFEIKNDEDNVIGKILVQFEYKVINVKKAALID